MMIWHLGGLNRLTRKQASRVRYLLGRQPTLYTKIEAGWVEDLYERHFKKSKREKNEQAWTRSRAERQKERIDAESRSKTHHEKGEQAAIIEGARMGGSTTRKARKQYAGKYEVSKKKARRLESAWDKAQRINQELRDR